MPRKPLKQIGPRQYAVDPDATVPVDDVEEALHETFPASDPPSWMPPDRVGTPKRTPEPEDAQ
jgi:hypothetical protein